MPAYHPKRGVWMNGKKRASNDPVIASIAMFEVNSFHIRAPLYAENRYQ